MRTPRQLCSGRAWQEATAPARQAWAEAGLPCSLCQQPIDYTLRYPHTRSLTVDHRTPLMHGGQPYDPTNWAPAHYGCNSARGSRDRARAKQTRRTELTW